MTKADKLEEKKGLNNSPNKKAFIKKGDFIEIDYVGRIKQSNQIFDITNEKTARENNLYNEKARYKPIVICIGNRDVVKGLDEALIGKGVGKHIIELSPEQAFGKKDGKLIKIVSINHFKHQNVRPIPGLQVDFDNVIGTVRSVSGGRVVVDFNHPLGGKHVVFEIIVNKILIDDEEKLKGFTGLYLDGEASLKDGIAKIELKKDLAKQIKDEIEKKIKELIPAVKKIEFVEVKNSPPKTN